jgi:hypothetical protein
VHFISRQGAKPQRVPFNFFNISLRLCAFARIYSLAKAPRRKGFLLIFKIFLYVSAPLREFNLSPRRQAAKGFFYFFQYFFAPLRLCVQ